MNLSGVFITITIVISIMLISGNQYAIYAEKDKDDNKLTERNIAELCGASEDYEAHKEQCDKLYDMLDKGIIKDDPDYEYD